MAEIWKDIKGYEGLYQVSSLGNIRSLNYNNQNRVQILKTAKQKNGYLVVGLSKNGNTKCARVHRLVAKEFIDNPYGKESVNHINGNKADNRVENLEWCTQTENMQHAKRTGLWKIEGKDNYKSKKIIQMDLNGKIIKSFDCIREAGRFLGRENKASQIMEVCKGKRNTAYGYKWRYI